MDKTLLNAINIYCTTDDDKVKDVIEGLYPEIQWGNLRNQIWARMLFQHDNGKPHVYDMGNDIVFEITVCRIKK